MSEYNPPSDPTSDPTSDPASEPTPGPGSSTPPPVTPPPPAAPATPPPPAAPATPPPPAAPQPPQANPYGGYTSAPTATPGYGQVMVGSLPYVEHHFGPVATFGPRFLAYLIDYLLTLLGLIPMIIGIVVMAASSAPTYDVYGDRTSSAPSGAGMGIGLLLMFLGIAVMIGIQVWNRWYRTGKTGQSVGKQVVGLKVINSTSGQTIGMGMAFVRDFINGLISPITQLWMLWDANRQTLGDMVAKSTVIVVPKN